MEFAEFSWGLSLLQLPPLPCVTARKPLPSLSLLEDLTNLSWWWLRLLATLQRGHLCLINPGGKEGVGIVKETESIPEE